MHKGFGAYFKKVLAMLPIFGFFLFFYEAINVLSFQGDTCFCNFEEPYKLYWEGYIGYDCMRTLKNQYQIVIYVKLCYYGAQLIQMLQFYYKY